MEKLAKKLLVLGLCLSMGVPAVATLSSCTPDENRTTTNQTEREELAAAVREYDALVSKLANGNFTYQNGEVKFASGAMQKGDEYYVTEDGKDYVITEQDGAWQKALTDKNVANERDAIISKFKNVEFEELKDGSLAGEINGVKVTVQKTANSINLKGGNIDESVSEIGTTKVNVPSAEDTKDPEQMKNQLIQSVENMLESIKKNKNFTYTTTGNDKSSTYEFAGNVACIDNETISYLEQNGTDNFEYIMENGQFHKRKSESSIDAIIGTLTKAFDNVKWNEYDQESGTLTGTCLGIAFEISLSGGTLEVKIAGKESTISKVGSTTVNLPKEFVDETAENNLIWTKDANGKIIYNFDAMQEVLEPWLKGENQFGKDYFSNITSKNKCEKVVYVSVKDNEIHFGNFLTENESKRLFSDKIVEGLYAKIQDNSVKTKEDMQKYLRTLSKFGIKTDISVYSGGIEFEYSTVDDDYNAEHKEEFEALTKNGFERLKNIGVQKEINGTGDKKTDYSGAKILFGFRTKLSDAISGAGLGSIRSWNNYLLIENNNKIQFVRIEMEATSKDGEDVLKSVIENKSDTWLVDGYEKKFELEKENISDLKPLFTLEQQKIKEF